MKLLLSIYHKPDSLKELLADCHYLIFTSTNSNHPLSHSQFSIACIEFKYLLGELMLSLELFEVERGAMLPCHYVVKGFITCSLCKT